MALDLFEQAEKFVNPEMETSLERDKTIDDQNQQFQIISENGQQNNDANMNDMQQDMPFGEEPEADSWETSPAGEFERGGRITKVGEPMSLIVWSLASSSGNVGKTKGELEKMKGTIKTTAPETHALITEDDKGYYLWLGKKTRKQNLLYAKPIKKNEEGGAFGQREGINSHKK
jgi:hypothetical protein